MQRIKMNSLNTSDLSLSNCLKGYLDKCKARNLSIRTLEIYEERLSVFLKFAESENVSTTDLSPNLIEKFILYLQARGCNDVTIQSYIRDLRAFFYTGKIYDEYRNGEIYSSGADATDTINIIFNPAKEELVVTSLLELSGYNRYPTLCSGTYSLNP